MEKKNPLLLYPRLRYALKKLIYACKKIHRKCLLECKIRFAIEKKKQISFGAILKKGPKNCCGHQKMIVKKLPYMNIV